MYFSSKYHKNNLINLTSIKAAVFVNANCALNTFTTFIF